MTYFLDSYNKSNSNNGAIDLNSPEGLLALAQARGGAVETAATEIMHPQTGILSSIGNGFKNAFNEFVDIINIPSYTVSGILHSATTGSNVIDSVVKANKENISVSDELFKGTMYDINPQDPFAEKALKWATRTSVDILTDPLTYMTFGASGVSKLGIKIPNLEATAIRGAVEAKATELGLTGSKRAAYIDQEFTKALDAAEIKNIYDVKYLIHGRDHTGEIISIIVTAYPAAGFYELYPCRYIAEQ